MNNAHILEQFLPEGTAETIGKWINHFRCDFTIHRSRRSKFGDYRSPYNGEPHRISVNRDLNRYAFLVTTVHEFAHLLTWNEHRDRAKPHGAEWKANFKRMMQPFFQMNRLPADVQTALKGYLENPAASSCGDLRLMRALKKYDDPKPDAVTVEKLPLGSIFCLPDGRTFRKQERLRKRYRCVEVLTNRVYLFSPVAEVKKVG
ncbi:MAG: SprT-like domain-containing protein [Mucilaginibacter polytrichastri]|nr:SprT-like domain-containing protein [Mucilaginibacter polytrichastri]